MLTFGIVVILITLVIGLITGGYQASQFVDELFKF